jgi:Spx/MgsR family transcriptional regulator
MLTIYGIPNCDTVKKTIKWLDAHKIAFVFHDFKTAGITAKKLEAWIGKAGLETVVNKKSTTFRNLPADLQQKMSNKREAIKIMQGQTSIIKRPVIELDDLLLVGYNEEAYSKFLSN